ncbi:hypothetical protein COCSUDRAFT_67882 [Coccomyxa subellipsoidea C-169]|uniref:Uncharacterized protein n=1 Tax=Coccomyxa subellipsoidea (strain C-169) TaxID=574566 RepID=I0YLY9_COCSC|nr:hypothetical protein COCSUDRAFT_67882 [Coccomyxa subellipsoidea C-169]EIE19408.1 hypothetical protein COCSUDRAFT_67882 [Coccomyxa subellipsoidea C-169]|eukprot:XP_005643952.1 hypothetical protein COCSUDRAFT_67882 [Coccomyxa subellipsoidea C-169]
MVLALAIHTVGTVSAKVPFAIVALLDHVRQKKLPPELKCRQVFPTSGLRSTSLWDTTDIETLQLWLDEFLDADCTNEVFEVQEDFAFGISAELTRLRTAEKVSAAVSERTKSAAAVASQQMTDLDAKYRVSQQAASAVQAAREASRVAGTRLATGFGKVHARAMENQQISAAATEINARWKRLGATVPFFNRSPSSSQGGSPLTHGTNPNFKEPTSHAAPPTSSAAHAQPGKSEEGTPTAVARPQASRAASASPAASPAKPPPAQAAAPPSVAPKPEAGKRDVFTLDDADV